MFVANNLEEANPLFKFRIPEEQNSRLTRKFADLSAI